MQDVTALIQAIAWPLVALIALVALWKALPDIVQDLGRRVTKISVFEVSIELATIPELKTTWQATPPLGDVRQPSNAELFDAPAQTLLEQFRDKDGFDYAVVDLGTGKEWLSSRLFVFAEMLPRLRGLRCFVFVDTVGATSRRLVGIARPEVVRWALAKRYPWLELALEEAYAETGRKYYDWQRHVHGLQQKEQGREDGQVDDQDEWYRQVTASTGAVEPGAAQEIGRAFLRRIQQQAKGEIKPYCEPGWVPVPKTKLCEHGEWLDGNRARALLGTGLQEDAWVKDNPDASEEEQVRAVLRRQGDLVAIVRDDKSFSRLVDRRLLLEELIARELREQSA